MLRDVTIVVKAFERPESLLRLYQSIRTYYPLIDIIIVDDSEEKVNLCEFENNVTYLATDFNIGLSAGRNYAVSNVKTKYFLLLDDDFFFTEK
ncbi:glycosyltransferase, partial [Halodesulfovibrio sp.]|uniref:glycosyltransferase family 2 protein n=1 Tax=Halodesulfovibrio sp. TaxID=1912772 RepID=UPI0025C3BFC5